MVPSILRYFPERFEPERLKVGRNAEVDPAGEPVYTLVFSLLSRDRSARAFQNLGVVRKNVGVKRLILSRHYPVWVICCLLLASTQRTMLLSPLR
jgi:hypothetical protein